MPEAFYDVPTPDASSISIEEVGCQELVPTSTGMIAPIPIVPIVPPVVVPPGLTWGQTILKVVKTRPFSTAAFTGFFFLIILAIPAGMRVNRRMKASATKMKELDRNLESLKQQNAQLGQQVQQNKNDADTGFAAQTTSHVQLKDKFGQFVGHYENEQEALGQDLLQMQNHQQKDSKEIKRDLHLYKAVNEVSKREALKRYKETMMDIYEQLDKQNQETKGNAKTFLGKCQEQDAKAKAQEQVFNDYCENTNRAFSATSEALGNLGTQLGQTKEQVEQTKENLEAQIEVLEKEQEKNLENMEVLATDFENIQERINETESGLQQTKDVVDMQTQTVNELNKKTGMVQKKVEKVTMQQQEERLNNFTKKSKFRVPIRTVDPQEELLNTQQQSSGAPKIELGNLLTNLKYGKNST